MPNNSIHFSFDLIVVGSGPGGYVAAIRAAQLGMKVACAERDTLGGTCLNIGCIPSKALLDASERYYDARHHFALRGINVQGISVDLAKMMSRKDEVVKSLTGGVGMLFRKNKIEHLQGHARVLSAGKVEVRGADGATSTHAAGRILLATGSAPIEIPGLPFDGKAILSSTEALSLAEAPAKMIVVGGGYIGVELGSVWSRLGSDVRVLEFTDRILPASDKEMALALQRLLEKQGLRFQFGTVAEKAQIKGNKVAVSYKTGEQRGVEEVDKVLVCVGRRPVTDKLGLQELGIQTDQRGYVKVDRDYQTSLPGIYAIGDVIGGVMLAHKAEEEGIAAVERMNGKTGFVNYHACPSVVYTFPELAQVGYTEEDAKSRGAIKIGKFPMMANGRAKGMAETDGFVKVIADAGTDRVLGVHILASRASEMIAEATLAMEFAAGSEDIGRSFHAHPTLPEALKEAALAVNKQAIHI